MQGVTGETGGGGESSSNSDYWDNKRVAARRQGA